MENASFNPFDDASTLEGKWFGMNEIETAEFLKQYPELSKLIEVRIPSSVLDNVGDFVSVDEMIFKHGTVYIQGDRLSEFNEEIQEIIALH